MNSTAWLWMGGRLLLGVVLVGLNAFFVAVELALVKVRDGQLEALIARGNRRARRALALKRNINAAIAATQFGITLASLGLGRFIEPLAEQAAHHAMVRFGLAELRWLDDLFGALAFAAVTFILIIAGEMVPKAITIQKTLPAALMLATPMMWFLRLTRPFISIIEHTATWLLRRFGIETGAEEAAHSQEELRLLFLATHRTLPGGQDLGRDIVLNSLDLRRRTVRDVMRPRNQITALSTAAAIAECLAVAEQSRYSRFPLCEDGNLDRARGVVHFKDLFAQRDRARTGADLLPVARKLIYVPETARLEKLLGLFLERRLHFAFVVDEYGGTTGMVTLENCLEEIVGQIQDEFDQEKPLLEKRGEDEWEVDGALPLFELAELVGETLTAEGVTTVSGWVTQRLGGFPKRGDVVTVGRHELQVVDLTGLRVARLRLRRSAASAGTGLQGTGSDGTG